MMQIYRRKTKSCDTCAFKAEDDLTEPCLTCMEDFIRCKIKTGYRPRPDLQVDRAYIRIGGPVDYEENTDDI